MAAASFTRSSLAESSKTDIFHDGALKQQGFLGHITDFPAQGPPVIILYIDSSTRTSPPGHHKSGNQSHQRRLTASRTSDDSRGLSRLSFKADMADSRLFAPGK